jgi:hypothetical protein
MFKNFSKKIEIAANLTIILLAVLLAVVLVKNHLLARKTPNQNQRANQSAESGLVKGTKLSSLDVDWKKSNQTLVLAISSACHFCTDSAPFYKTLVQNKKDTRVVAVLPQSLAEGTSYLQKLGVSVDEIKQLRLDKIGVQGTPTLLLLDGSGALKDFWVGKLTPDKEDNILKSL